MDVLVISVNLLVGKASPDAAHVMSPNELNILKLLENMHCNHYHIYIEKSLLTC